MTPARCPHRFAVYLAEDKRFSSYVGTNQCIYDEGHEGEHCTLIDRRFHTWSDEESWGSNAKEQQ